MNRGKKISIASIELTVMFLLLIESPYIPQRINNIIKFAVELFIILIIVSTGEVKKKAFSNTIPSLLFLLVCCYSTFRWSGFSSRLMNTFVTNLAYVLFFYICYTTGTKYGRRIIKTIKNNLVFYIVLLDFFAIVTWGKGLGGLPEAVYLLGNKFMVSYFHMALLALMLMDNPNNRLRYNVKIIAYTLYSLFICRVTDTMTGVIGIISIYAFYILIIKRPKIFKVALKPIAPIMFFLGTNSLFLLSDIIIGNSYISAFFLKYSHTDTLLSGRLPMYKIVMNAITNNPVWGYGLNYDIVLSTLGFGNPQNGLLKMLLDSGVVGTIVFLIMILFVFMRVLNSESLFYSKGLVAFIYGMLVCSLVEINIVSIFYLFLAMMLGITSVQTCENVSKRYHHNTRKDMN